MNLLFYKSPSFSKFKKNNTGIALVEVLVSSAIISAGILAVISTYTTYVSYAFSSQYNTQSSHLMEEGLEVVSFFRDSTWSNISGLSTTTTYYLTFSGTAWATTTTPQYVDSFFLRSITVSDVERDLDDRITDNGVIDPNTKLITARVDFYHKGATSTRTMSTYITNLYDN